MRIEIFTDKTKHKKFKKVINGLGVHYMNKDINSRAHIKEYTQIVEDTKVEELPIVKQGETLYIMGKDFNTEEESIELIKKLGKELYG